MKVNNLLTIATHFLIAIMLAGFLSGIVNITMERSPLYVKNECHDTRTDCLPE